MLWLLPLDVGPVRVRLDPGTHVVPRWYDDAELAALVEVLRRVLEPAAAHAVVLPAEALATAAFERMSPAGSVLVAVQGELDAERRPMLDGWARKHGHHVLMSARADADELATGWLERSIKPAVVWLLERGAWAQGHPLDAFGIEGLGPDAVARTTEDPIEMLWLLEHVLRHRLHHAEQGLGERDYLRSLRHAVGMRCAKRLRPCGVWVRDALDVIVGGPRTIVGWSALVGTGLGVWREGVFEPGPLLRALEEDDAAALESMIEAIGEGVLSAEASEALRERRRAMGLEASAPPVLASMAVSDTRGSPDGALLAAALREGVEELVDAPPLLGEVVEAIDHWGEMHWNEQRIEALRDARLRLRGLVDTPVTSHRRLARIEEQVLAILTAHEHAQLLDARAAHEALRLLLGAPPGGWELDLWLHATLECAKQHIARAEDREDFEHAARLLAEIIATGEQHSRPWHVAAARWHLAAIAIRRGQLDEALQCLREQVLPVFQRLGAVREEAVTMGTIADILQARGDLDEALHVLRDTVLPAFERLGHLRSKAATMGKIADILQARGDLDQALRIRQHEELPVYERLGDVHSKAITMGEIADILQARGDLDQALRILRDDVLPTVDRLGDVQSKAVTLTKIAHLRLQQADAAARSEATDLLTQAHRIFVHMRLPEAEAVRETAKLHGLDLEISEPA